MARKPLPSQETLRQLLDYDPKSGKLFWKERPPTLFRTAQAWKAWNTKHAGREVSTGANSHGYSFVGIYGRRYAKHRIIWKFIHGADPLVIDHDNGDKADNREINLVDGTKAENTKNRKRPQNNTSGVIGVSRRSDTGKWCAYIGAGMKKIKLGTFSTLEEAAAVRKAAEIKHGFHSAHGR